jgi:hypothetical protein
MVVTGNGTVTPDQLCGVSKQDYTAFVNCMCGAGGACSSICGNSLCTGGTANAACNTCAAQTGATGCGDELNACKAH